MIWSLFSYPPSDQSFTLSPKPCPNSREALACSQWSPHSCSRLWSRGRNNNMNKFVGRSSLILFFFRGCHCWDVVYHNPGQQLWHPWYEFQWVFCISGKRRQAWVWHLQKEIPKLGMGIRHHRWWGQIQKHLGFHHSASGSGTQLYFLFLLRVFLVLLLRLTVFLGQGVSPLQSSVGQPLCELLRIKVTCNKSIWWNPELFIPSLKVNVGSKRKLGCRLGAGIGLRSCTQSIGNRAS